MSATWVADLRDAEALRDVGMTATLIAPPDASALAAEIRQLARRAHRLLKEPVPPHRQLVELSQQVIRLRSEVTGREDLPVTRWLDSLERLLPTVLA